MNTVTFMTEVNSNYGATDGSLNGSRKRQQKYGASKPTDGGAARPKDLEKEKKAYKLLVLRLENCISDTYAPPPDGADLAAINTRRRELIHLLDKVKEQWNSTNTLSSQVHNLRRLRAERQDTEHSVAVIEANMRRHNNSDLHQQTFNKERSEANAARVARDYTGIENAHNKLCEDYKRNLAKHELNVLEKEQKAAAVVRRREEWRAEERARRQAKEAAIQARLEKFSREKEQQHEQRARTVDERQLIHEERVNRIKHQNYLRQLRSAKTHRRKVFSGNQTKVYVEFGPNKVQITQDNTWNHENRVLMSEQKDNDEKKRTAESLKARQDQIDDFLRRRHEKEEQHAERQSIMSEETLARYQKLLEKQRQQFANGELAYETRERLYHEQGEELRNSIMKHQLQSQQRLRGRQNNTRKRIYNRWTAEASRMLGGNVRGADGTEMVDQQGAIVMTSPDPATITV